ncbi:TPA: hypothetical protein KOT44_002258, partial [Clostridioides difficile]|nr:hypothetical protein [Clostridioides difficile]
LKRKKEQLLKEIEDEYIYVDCKDETIDKVDSSKFDKSKKVIFYNTGQLEVLKDKNKNKKD